MSHKQDEILILIHNDQTNLNFDDVIDFAKKHVCNIKKELYRNIFKISTIYMLEKVIETSSFKILSDYYHTNLKKETRKKNVKKLQETFSR